MDPSEDARARTEKLRSYKKEQEQADASNCSTKEQIDAEDNPIVEETLKSDKHPDIGLKELAKKLEDFAKARDWEQYHTPRNLLLAMIGEVGELSEIFQWRGEVEKGLPNWEESDKEHLGEELSDVLLYLIRLADICGIDLALASIKKIAKNGIKYPVPN